MSVRASWIAIVIAVQFPLLAETTIFIVVSLVVRALLIIPLAVTRKLHCRRIPRNKVANPLVLALPNLVSPPPPLDRHPCVVFIPPVTLVGLRLEVLLAPAIGLLGPQLLHVRRPV